VFYQLLIAGVVLGLIVFYAFEGLFNALLAAVCAIAAAVVAFNFFEPLARAMGDSATGIGLPIALTVLFVAVMEGLRFGATKLLPGMVHFPPLVDRIGGAVLGAVPALVIAGVLAICFRLLPFGPGVMGYRALVAPPTTGQGQLFVEPLWLRPDAFTVGLVDKLSAGALSGGQVFDQIHPDYLAELSGFNDFATATKEPFTGMALDNLTLYGHGEEAPGKPVKWETRTVPARGEFRDPVDKAKRSDVRTPILALTVRVRQLPEEEAAVLTAPQAQLTCRTTDGSIRTIVPQWIAENPKKPSEVLPFPIDKSWMGKVPQNITLIYDLPKDCTPKYLTIKRDTRIDPEIRGDKDKWTVQPYAVPGSPAADINTTWLTSAGWAKAVSPDMPVVLVAKPVSATSPDADVNPKLVGARVTLAPDKSVATARVMGPDMLLREWAIGSPANKLFIPPGRKVVQLKCSPVEKIPAEDWAALLSGAAVTVDDKPVGSVAGLAVIYINKDVRFCYDPAPGARFADFAPDRTDIDRLVLLIVIPADAHAFKLDISKDLKMLVDLGKQ